MIPTYMQVPNYKRPVKKASSSYTPIPDGFVSSAGNKELAQKYGNNTELPGLTTSDLLSSFQKSAELKKV